MIKFFQKSESGKASDLDAHERNIRLCRCIPNYPDKLLASKIKPFFSIIATLYSIIKDHLHMVLIKLSGNPDSFFKRFTPYKLFKNAASNNSLNRQAHSNGPRCDPGTPFYKECISHAGK